MSLPLPFLHANHRFRFIGGVDLVSVWCDSAVAECYVSPDRVHLYASPDTLGQAFAFDLMIQPYRARELRECVEKLYKVAREAGSTTTWCLSNHDVCTRTRRALLYSELEDRRTDHLSWSRGNRSSATQPATLSPPPQNPSSKTHRTSTPGRTSCSRIGGGTVIIRGG